MITRVAYTRHIKRLIIMAEKPRVMMISLKKGRAATVPGFAFAGLEDSIWLKIINTTNAPLHIRVNFEKKEITFISRHHLL